ncbi:DUF5801 repeats-in-toxin domain-containing protein, partial [Mesorhizobium sp. BAC0120]|uniref:DUF5801 repeats-in-toxin domain-containing protein n=1 Tax=Mesorhizobium sp. BAC0120 TaxID=3090670 RepID=UPI00298C2994
MATSFDLDGAASSMQQDEAQAQDWPMAASTRMAQAETPSSDDQAAGPAPAGDPQPVDVGQGTPPQSQGNVPSADAQGAGASNVYTVGENNTVKLPANVSIDNIRIEGGDLVLQQADGTLITIKDAALHVPTFIIGEVEIPRVALLAALEASGVQVAFGNDGSISVSAAAPSAESSGGNFEFTPGGGIGEGLNYTALLGQTDPTVETLENSQLLPPLNLLPSLDISGDYTVDEAALPGGTSPSDIGQTTSGSFTINIGDGLQSVVINGTDVTNGGTVSGAYGTLIVTRNPDGSYSWTYKLTGPTSDHHDTNSAGTNEGVFDNFNVVVTDANGDKATGALKIDILDDGPTIDLSGRTHALVVDESFLPSGSQQGPSGSVHAEASFADAFKVTTGADGGTTSYALAVTTGASGLVDAQSGQSVILSLKGGIVEARTSGSGELVFTVKVDAGTGKVEFDLFRSVKEADSSNPNDATSLSANLIRLVATVTDGDGDHASQTLNIGNLLTIRDDGPVIGRPQSTSVDEEGLPSGNAGDSYPGGREAAGGDLAGEAKQANGNLNISFGADGPHATSAIVLAATGATWTQATATTGTLAANDGSWQIVVKADGTYTFTLLKPLAHTGADVEDDVNINVTVTARDGDGDTQQAAFSVTVNDDAPVFTANPESASVDEEGLAGGNPGDSYPGGKEGAGGDLAGEATTANGNLNISFGADGPHATAAIVLAATGATWTQTSATTGTLAANDGSWQIVVNEGGTYTFTLLKPIAHPGANIEDDIKIDVTVTARDGDGDTQQGAFSVTVNDDAPVVSGQHDAAIKVDEDDILNLQSVGTSPNDGTGDGSSTDPLLAGGAATASGSVSALVNFGADGPAAGGGFSFTADAAATMAALGLQSKGGVLSFAVVGNALIGYVDNGNGKYNAIGDRTVL